MKSHINKAVFITFQKLVELYQKNVWYKSHKITFIYIYVFILIKKKIISKLWIFKVIFFKYYWHGWIEIILLKFLYKTFFQ